MSGIEWPVVIWDSKYSDDRLVLHLNSTGFFVEAMEGDHSAQVFIDRAGLATLRAALEAAELEMS